MPTIQIGAYRVQFFEADLRERPHVHVRRERMQAKYWLTPDIALFRNRGFALHELTRIEDLLRQYQSLLLQSWESERRKQGD